MPKPLKPTSIKFTDAQRKYLKQRARAERHGKVSQIIKKLIDREMNMAV